TTCFVRGNKERAAFKVFSGCSLPKTPVKWKPDFSCSGMSPKSAQKMMGVSRMKLSFDSAMNLRDAGPGAQIKWGMRSEYLRISDSRKERWEASSGKNVSCKLSWYSSI